ncbi:glucans biosynthesis protein [Cribrihabitans marinus]|uniref:Glucans biosynthesis protein n=1 Tax=Cribrihabitans marinus TaxID=1227549 RepID=A0A1H7B052_9RHOB|nr:glucan biosynthesis protein G [Cribrihabitans marinus]GGH32816.1 glucans biosynthesis protein G 1 [Cribrihabitans marinus]SEJ70576.1 glucans biosynthesis protein [Cribrihabitans marinus]
MTLSRRTFLSSISALALSSAAGATGIGMPFDPGMVVAEARDLASRPYAPRPTIPQAWRDLTYEQYRSIRFRPERTLWNGTDAPFNVDFFPPGLYFPRAVKVFEVSDGNANPVEFDLSMFDKSEEVPQLPVDDTLGFSGLRLRTEMHRPGLTDEFCVFQGASYFRAIGLYEVYGLSARGLALNTAGPDGEEFPDFTRFWLERPAPGQDNMIVHALMDSPSVTGAYRFDIRAGADCVMEVQATLFPRTELENVGLGPLTSMFLYDQTGRTRFDDFRPAVHDSNGLMIRNGAGEVIWRPLSNPRRLQVSSFVDDGPQGFGLMQRARDFSDFNDLEAMYHKRPGLWVEPMGNWGRGTVTLVEIPADQEIYDNIVAYWRPATPVPVGQPFEIGYRLTWGEEPATTPLPRVTDTAMGDKTFGTGRLVVIDFEATELHADIDVIVPIVQSPHTEMSEPILQRNPETGGLRLAFSFDPGERDHVELRAQLRKDGAMASEVWLYRWTA